VLVNGSPGLLSTLVEHELVDEYLLVVFPTVLGSGKRFFTDGSRIPALELVETSPSGRTVSSS
jgi:dihydrofolate reductase